MGQRTDCGSTRGTTEVIIDGSIRIVNRSSTPC